MHDPVRARFLLPLAIFVAVALVLAACSGGGSTLSPSTTPSPSATPSTSVSAGARTIQVTTTDTMRFEPATFEAAVGETVIFEVTNVGQIVHEFYVGTPEDQAAHEVEMKSGHSTHDHENSLSVDPGQTKTLQLTFAKPGSLEVGCHVPGHWDAGMRGTLTVK